MVTRGELIFLFCYLENGWVRDRVMHCVGVLALFIFENTLALGFTIVNS